MPRLDHVNYLARNAGSSGAFVRNALGGFTKHTRIDDGTVVGLSVHVGQKSYDLVCTRDRTGSTGRLHHITFAADTREDILRCPDRRSRGSAEVGSG